MLKINPITFKAVEGKESAYIELHNTLEKQRQKINKIKDTNNKLSALKELNNFIYKNIVEGNLWKDIPADTRFPGYFSSLADHAIATTSIAVPLALDLHKKGFDFASEYDDAEIKDLLSSKDGVVEICRLLSLLHDVGKHPPQKHYVRTREHVEKILKLVGLTSISKTLAESASKHHYRHDIEEGYKPNTKLEWIVAFADKVSSTQDRSLSGELIMLLEPLKWIREMKSDENINKIIKFINNVKQDTSKIRDFTNDEIICKLIPINFERLREIDKKIFNASEIINDVKIGILCIEVAGISKFVTASDYKKYISGASALIDNTLDKVKNEIENMLCPECIVYAKGGSLLAVIPPSYFEQIKEKAHDIFEKNTKVVNLKLPNKDRLEFELWELKYGPQIYKDDNVDAETLLKLAKNRNFGSVVSFVINSLETTEEVSNPEVIRVGEICPICHEYKKSNYEHLIGNKKEKVCKRCNLVIEENKKLRSEDKIIHINFEKEQLDVKVEPEKLEPCSYTRIIKRIENILKNKLANNPVVSDFKSKGVTKIFFAPVKTWDSLGRQHIGKDYTKEQDEIEEVYDIAFIKGDGDNFGKIKEGATSITIHRQMSKLFEEVIEGSIAEALSEVIIKQLEIRIKKDVKDAPTLELPFDIVFVGGDDFLILIDAAFIFIFLKEFRKSIQKKLGERKNNFKKEKFEPLSVVPLGVSMGIAIVKNRMPIKSTLDVLNDLLYRSKQKSKSEAKGFGGEIYISLKKFESIPNVDYVKKVFEGDKKVRHTQFPMNGKDFLSFIDCLKFFIQNDVSPNWIKSVFDCSKSPLDAYIDLLYKLARTKGTKEREILEKIESMHKTEFKNRSVFTFKHLDIAESLEIVSGKLSLEGLPTKEIMLKLLGE